MSFDAAPTEVDDQGDLRDLHKDVRLLITKIGELKTQIDNDAAERRALLWAKRPLWLLALSGLVLAGVELYCRVKAAG